MIAASIAHEHTKAGIRLQAAFLDTVVGLSYDADVAPDAPGAADVEVSQSFPR
jgi:hypothetical protein